MQNEITPTQPVTVAELLATWERQRTSEELQAFVGRHLDNHQLADIDLEA